MLGSCQTKEPFMAFTTFQLGMIAGGAIIFLFPGVGAGGNRIYKHVIKPIIDRIF